MTDKLAAWRHEKQRGSVNRRPLTEGRKMATSDFSASKQPQAMSARKGSGDDNDENFAASASGPNSSAKAGWGAAKKATPSTISKRKVEHDGQQRVLTPVQKKTCTPTSRKARDSVTVSDVIAKLEPFTQGAMSLVDKKREPVRGTRRVGR